MKHALVTIGDLKFTRFQIFFRYGFHNSFKRMTNCSEFFRDGSKKNFKIKQTKSHYFAGFFADTEFSVKFMGLFLSRNYCWFDVERLGF
jgi:hypothetical protein